MVLNLGGIMILKGNDPDAIDSKTLANALINFINDHPHSFRRVLHSGSKPEASPTEKNHNDKWPSFALVIGDKKYKVMLDVSEFNAEEE
jgi:hypothetical protein